MSNIEGASAAAHIANTDALLALVSALSASGVLAPEAFKEHLQKVQRIQKGNSVVNEHFYDTAIKNLIGASEGLLK